MANELKEPVAVAATRTGFVAGDTITNRVTGDDGKVVDSMGDGTVYVEEKYDGVYLGAYA